MERSKGKKEVKSKPAKAQEELEEVKEQETPETFEVQEEKVPEPEPEKLPEPVEYVDPSTIPQRFKKVGGGSLRIGNRIIKPGEIFKIAPRDIKPAFRDVVIPVGGYDWSEKKKEAPPIQGVKPVYTVQPRGDSKTWWDVVDKAGKVINEKGLKKEVAEKLVQDLMK